MTDPHMYASVLSNFDKVGTFRSTYIASSNMRSPLKNSSISFIILNFNSKNDVANPLPLKRLFLIS